MTDDGTATDSGASSMSERLADAGYAAGWSMVQALPEKMASRLFRLGADAAARRQGPQSQLRRNLGRVLGMEASEVPDATVRNAMRSYARYWQEAFRLPAMDKAAIARDLDDKIAGLQHLDQALAAGRGVVVALPHSANWDIGGLWLAYRYGGFTTVAERLKPESLYQRFVDYREQLGFTILPHTGGTVPPYKALRETLGRNEIVCLLGERDLRRSGVPVNFFGAETRMPAGPAKLAIDTGATLLTVRFWYQGPTMRIAVESPISTDGGVGPTTQRIADRFAAAIADHPIDWHMLQPLWIDDLEQSHIDAIEVSGQPDAEGEK